MATCKAFMGLAVKGLTVDDESGDYDSLILRRFPFFSRARFLRVLN